MLLAIFKLKSILETVKKPGKIKLTPGSTDNERQTMNNSRE